MKKLSLLAVVPLVLALAGTALAQTLPKLEDPIELKVDAVAPVEAVVPVEAIVPVEASGPVAVVEEEYPCGSTEAIPETIPATAAASSAGCKQCKNRTWCKCTYNGLPRVSCDPCCYGAWGGATVCFD